MIPYVMFYLFGVQVQLCYDYISFGEILNFIVILSAEFLPGVFPIR